MRIVLLTHKFYPDVGGIEVNSEVLADQFYSAGHEVRVVTWSTGQPTRSFPYEIIRNPSILRLLKVHLWGDVVYENNPCLRLAWPAALLNKPSVIALRTWICRMDGRISVSDKLKFLWLRRAQAVIAVSKAVQERTWPNATVIGNPYRDTIFEHLNCVRDRDFVFLGRLVSDKGADYALEALARLINNLESCKGPSSLTLTIIGDGPERARLENLTASLGIEGNVFFTGSLGGSALVKELNRHRSLLVPSLWEEPFGNVALEGMACGCVPIVSDGGGLPDAIGVAGLTFRRGSIEALAGCMNRLLSEANLEQDLRAAALNHLSSHRPATVARRYLDIIETAVSRI